jgi:hypothetical protein
MTATQNESDGDILWGVAAIAHYIKRSKRQTHYLISKRRIPVEKPGPKTITGSKSKISAALKGDVA